MILFLHKKEGQRYILFVIYMFLQTGHQIVDFYPLTNVNETLMKIRKEDTASLKVANNKFQ